MASSSLTARPWIDQTTPKFVVVAAWDQRNLAVTVPAFHFFGMGIAICANSSVVGSKSRVTMSGWLDAPAIALRFAHPPVRLGRIEPAVMPIVCLPWVEPPPPPPPLTAVHALDW